MAYIVIGLWIVVLAIPVGGLILGIAMTIIKLFSRL